MAGGGQTARAARATRYCVVPADLAATAHDPLRRHFRNDPAIDVIVEQRASERRSGGERRATAGALVATERRRIRGRYGRRVGERRALLVPVDALDLPRGLRRYAERLQFVERLEPSGLEAEDRDTARLVMRIQAGDRDAFPDLY